MNILKYDSDDLTSIVISVILLMLPYTVIHFNDYLLYAIIAVIVFFTMENTYVLMIYWLIGLICAIVGSQNVWAIIYYFAFAIIWIPFFKDILLSVIEKHR